MKKTTFRKFITLCGLILIINSTPAYAHEITPSETNSIQINLRSTTSFGSQTISTNTIATYKPNNLNMSILKGDTAKFTCKFNRSAKVQIGFYNTTTGTSKSLYSGTTSSKTVSYTPSSKVSGYFYIKNLSGSSLTVSSASITY